MTVSIKALAELVEGNLVGNPSIQVVGAASLKNASANNVTFVENQKYFKNFNDSPCLVAICPEQMPASDKTLIVVKDPLQAFIKVVRFFKKPLKNPPSGVSPLASLGDGARVGQNSTVLPFARIGEDSIVGENCFIHSGVVIGRNCIIGNNCILHPNVVIYDECILDDHVTIHANTVIGADGFGYRFDNGKHTKVTHLGNVVLGKHVEIGACSAIDRSTFGTTIIGEGTKVDNLVQIGHNCEIGKHNLLVAQVGIAGSCSTGDYVIIAGQAGLAGHLHVGDKVTIGAKSGLMRDASEGEKLLGAPARPERDEKRILLSLDKLPELCRDVRKIKQHLNITDD